MNIIDRVLTIVVTATVTSAIWIVAGGSLIENATGDSQRQNTRPAESAPSPSPTRTGPSEAGSETPVSEEARNSKSLNTEFARMIEEGEAKDLIIPVLNVSSSELTDTFTDSRGGGGRLHEAIDIMAPRGTSVIAAGPGIVEKLYESEAGGNTIYVRSSDGRTIHYYAHLDRYAKGLKEGQQVPRGKRLGEVGSSGNASEDAPHLHFAILQTTKDAAWWEPANAINPYPLLSSRQTD